MTVRAFLAGAALVGAGVTLCGCGGSAPTPAPTPAPTSAPTSAPTPAPGPVELAFNSHFAGFAAGVGASGNDLEEALKKFMLDFDADSTVAVFNDACAGWNQDASTIQGYTLYDNEADIKTFFRAQMLQLKSLNNLADVGPFKGGFVLQEGDKPKGNVFLTWRTNLTAPNEIKYATDSFSWKIKDGVAKIWRQNEVTTEPGKSCGAAVAHTASNCAVDSATAVCTGWKNHLDAFGEGANANGDAAVLEVALTKIMDEYTADSFVQVFDNRVKLYETFDTPEKIKVMFRKLFTDINAAKAEAEVAPVKVKVLDVDEKINGVFLVWESLSHPKATDTFVFSDAGKIIRQNIVVMTKVPENEVNVMV